MLTYQSLDGQVATGDPQIQRWILETSKAAGQNLIPYFETWKWPVSSDTRTAIAALNLAPMAFNASDPCNTIGGPNGIINTCYLCCADYYNQLMVVPPPAPPPSGQNLTVSQQHSADYAALIANLTPGVALPFGDLGGPGVMTLYGNTFKVVLNIQKQTVMAAGRVGAGRLVAFNKEGAWGVGCWGMGYWGIGREGPTRGGAARLVAFNKEGVCLGRGACMVLGYCR